MVVLDRFPRNLIGYQLKICQFYALNSQITCQVVDCRIDLTERHPFDSILGALSSACVNRANSPLTPIMDRFNLTWHSPRTLIWSRRFIQSSFLPICQMLVGYNSFRNARNCGLINSRILGIFISNTVNISYVIKLLIRNISI